jgi:geranylgeranyl reductase family protein
VSRVVVVGAGPAGSAAALALAEFRGIEAVLLERGTFPRPKPCGSGLSPWALAALDRMDVGRRVRATAYPIRAARIGRDGSPPLELRSRHEAAVFLRSDFDMLLAHEASRRGAALREGVRVHGLIRHDGRLVGVETSAGPIEADAVIVCSGSTGGLAREPRPGVTLNSIMGWYEGVDDVSDAVELYFDAAVRPYYGWLFPESRTRANIGICYAPAPGAPNARERFEAFVATRFGKRMRRAERLGRLVGHPIATTRSPRAVVRQGALVAGEAARLVDPATAEGIYHALESGAIAGRVLGGVLADGRAPSVRHLAPYSRMIRRRLGRRLAAGHVLVKLFETPLLDLALRFGSVRQVQRALTWALAHA